MGPKETNCSCRLIRVLTSQKMNNWCVVVDQVIDVRLWKAQHGFCSKDVSSLANVARGVQQLF